jgi:hypothetical protein
MNPEPDLKPEPAYLSQLRDLAARGAFQSSTVVEVQVAHDDGCTVWTRRACNCESTGIPPPLPGVVRPRSPRLRLGGRGGFPLREEECER